MNEECFGTQSDSDKSKNVNRWNMMVRAFAFIIFYYYILTKVHVWWYAGCSELMTIQENLLST